MGQGPPNMTAAHVFHVQSATESDKPEGVQVSEIVYKMKTKTAGDVGTVYAPTNRLN